MKIRLFQFRLVESLLLYEPFYLKAKSIFYRMFRSTRHLPEKQMYVLVHRYGNKSYALNICNLKDPIIPHVKTS